MPLVIIMLGLLGIIDAQTLREKRKIAIMLVAVLSAIVTPPDALSMLSLLIPMALLYELSIIIVGVLAKKRAAKVKE
jgi:sec-independent protein translocase protein TatC